jgi:mannose-6-phosphate isomerase-like protein (cupin superfamily)
VAAGVPRAATGTGFRKRSISSSPVRAQGPFNGEVVDLEPWTAVRVPPETARAFRAAGDEDAVFVTIAAPQAGLDDVEFIKDYWID